jgi:hypothetical protein
MLVIRKKRSAASRFVSPSSAVSALSALSVLGSALAPLSFASDARADDTKRACVAASTDGQTLQKADKLIEARDKLHFCASSSCPEIVRSRCTRWLSDLDAEIPSVIVRAKDAEGSDILDIDVTIDGHAITAGRQETLDPGEHVVVVTRPDGQTKQEKFLLVDGERARVLTVHLGEHAPPPAAPSASPQDKDKADEGQRGGIPTGAWVLGGLSLVAFGGAVFFYAQAASDFNQAQKTCSPSCGSSVTQPVLVNEDLSYVSIGVGVAALGGAIAWALLDHPPKPAKSAAVYTPVFDVRPAARGALTTLGFRF